MYKEININEIEEGCTLVTLDYEPSQTPPYYFTSTVEEAKTEGKHLLYWAWINNEWYKVTR